MEKLIYICPYTLIWIYFLLGRKRRSRAEEDPDEKTLKNLLIFFHLSMDINKDKEQEFGSYIKSHYYYDPDEGKIFGIKRQKEVGFLGRREKYKKISIFKPHYKHKKINFLFSRVCWFLHYGEWPKDQIDHINMNVLDNRIENLRGCNASENLSNRAMLSTNKTGYKNVSWSKYHKKYKVTLGKNKVQLHGGYFSDIQQAIDRAEEMRTKYHGEFKRA